MQMRKRAFVGGGAVLGLGALAIVYLTAASSPQTPQELVAQRDTAPAGVGAGLGPEQPIAYSHRTHAGNYAMDCLYCHTNADRSYFVPIPPVAVCMGCHQVIQGATDAAREQITTLRGYWQRQEPIPWVRIHKLADFVQFNHGRHIKAEIVCQDCHGPIETMDVVYQWSPLTMGWCLECHWQPADEAKLAEAQRFAERYHEAGWEDEHSLYPKSINSSYGVLKGPIDCAACHY